MEGLELLLPCGGVYHYRCWLPVLISAAYSAVHEQAVEQALIQVFSAAYSAVHVARDVALYDAIFSAAYSAVHDLPVLMGMYDTFSAAYSAVHLDLASSINIGINKISTKR
ncbi:hypothetical protein [Halomonas sp.]|uniref:hypothetical protein n=1 Tax=Halomonas sp. TaxID=1486246 RepID=UPI003F99152E